MKIIREVIVTVECTEGEEVNRYICNTCGEVVRSVAMKRKNYTRKKLKYSKLIFIDKCNSCKKIR